MSDYVPTNWVDNVTPVDESRMDHLEAGVDQAVGVVQDTGRLAAGAAAVTDWNTVQDNGWYRGSPGTNAPSAFTGTLVIVRVERAQGFVTQTAWQYALGNTILAPKYERRYDGSWGPWILIATDPATFIPKSIVTAKGDMLIATGSGTVVRFPVGSNGQIIQADSTDANGAKWVTPVAASALSYDGDWAAGTYQDGQVVIKDGVAFLCVAGPTTVAPDITLWGLANPVATMGTGLPGSPTDGQEFILVDSLTAPTYAWRLRYVSAKSTNKWVFIGGSWLRNEVATAETTATTTYVDLTTAGPSLTVPIAGVYEVLIAALLYSAGSSASGAAAVKVGAAATSDDDGVGGAAGQGLPGVAGTRTMFRTYAASAVLKLQYRAYSGTLGAKGRVLGLRPVEIGG